jgi:hypothetical protein
VSTNISRLVEMAKRVQVTEDQKREHRNSFVYGNTKLEYSQVTKGMVEDVSRKRDGK